MAHGQFILGPEVNELEVRLAEHVGVKHCITVANGSDALLIAQMALGIGLGDEVITTPFSFFASSSMTVRLGAKPVYVDIDPQTYNIDASLIEAAISPRTKAILSVNLYGQCADYNEINRVASKHNLVVIEDAAQSIGATYHGQPSGSLGRISCTSFFPSKPLGCYGDGGACFTDDDDIAEKMRQLRNHGQDRKYHHVRLGINSRLDSMQAAILLEKLTIFPRELELRRALAEQFRQQLPDTFVPPVIAPQCSSSYAQYTVQVEQREPLITYLQQQGIPTAIHYPMLLSEQPCLVDTTLKQGTLQVATQTAKRVLSLPFHPYMTSQHIDELMVSLARFMEDRCQIA